MTMPMIVGVGMTISCLLYYRLRSRFWRKWLGLTMMVLGGILMLSTSGTPRELFFVLLMTTTTGYSLFGDRDHFTEDEE